jgi:hypothetical protein
MSSRAHKEEMRGGKKPPKGTKIKKGAKTKGMKAPKAPPMPY